MQPKTVAGSHVEWLYSQRMKDTNTFQGADRIELMHTFVRIVEAGSLTAAAKQLNTTQPTVSRRLKALEQGLGIQLLRRSTHAMQLTDDGERCYTHAKEVVASWEALSSDLLGTRETPQGMLRVVVPHAFGQQQLVIPLAQYAQRYPDVHIEWLLNDQMPDFVTDNIDCAIHVGTNPDPSVVAVLLAEIPRIVVASPSCPEIANKLPDIDQLARLPWLALRTFYRNDLMLSHRTTGEQRKLHFRPRISTDNLQALRSAALLGLGAAVVSAWAVQEDLQAKKLIHLVPDWQATPLPVYLVYPQARHYSSPLRAFLALMREAIPDVPGTTRRQHNSLR
jgi:DNA-binding transcriptional LysR family regulator